MNEVIKKIIGIEKSKIYICFKIMLSLFFAITLFLDSLLVFNGTIDGTVKDIYFNFVGIKNVLILFASFVGTYIGISILEIVVDKLQTTIYAKKGRKLRNIYVYLIILGAILLCWLPTVLSYFPGGVYSDTISSIRQALGVDPLSNHHPILYAFLLKFFFSFGSSHQIALEIFTVFQVLLMAATLSISVYWLYKKGISTKYIVLITAFFGLFRLIPIYAISLWKDTIFCIALFGYILYIAETVFQDGKNLEKITGVIAYAILMLLVCFFRNNGIYITIATTLVIMIVYRRKLLKQKLLFSIVTIISLIVTLIIQGPVYKKLKLSTEFIENLGVPIQQICYVVAKDGNITEFQREFINEICPIEKIKETYNPCLVDKVKWNGNFNNAQIEDNKVYFFKVWGKLLLQNPTSYVKAYLLNTIGFWDVNKATTDAYINPQMWGEKDILKYDGIEEVKQTDYIKEWTGKSAREIVTPSVPISSAIFLFILLFTALLTIYKKRFKNLLIYLPSILTWGTIMIAVPLAFSLRYVYILVLTTPLSLITPFLKQKEKKDEEA